MYHNKKNWILNFVFFELKIMRETQFEKSARKISKFPNSSQFSNDWKMKVGIFLFFFRLFVVVLEFSHEQIIIIILNFKRRYPFRKLKDNLRKLISKLKNGEISCKYWFFLVFLKKKNNKLAINISKPKMEKNECFVLFIYFILVCGGKFFFFLNTWREGLNYHLMVIVD